MRFQYFLLFLAIPLSASAQYNSDAGFFTVDEKKGCGPLTVNIIAATDCPCFVNWGDGATGGTSHQYTQPGTYTLRVNSQSIGNDQIIITVTPNLQPAFDALKCNGNQIQVKVTDTNYDSYFINFGDGSPDVAVPKGMLAVSDHSYAPGTYTILVRGKDVNADDNCVSAASQPITVSNALTAPFINTLTVAGTNQIDLDLSTSPNTLYQLDISVAPNIASFQPIQTIHDVASTSVSSSSLRPDDNFYCFRLGTLDPCNTATPPVPSNIICSANFDLSIQNNLNNLTWATSTAGVANFTVNRDGVAIGTPGASPFPDNNVVCNTNYCYQLLTNYANGSQSISLEKCGTAISTNTPAPVENVTAVVGDGNVDLVWQQNPAFQATEYRIFRKSGSENFELLSTSGTTQYLDNTYTTSGQFCYRIDYTDACNNLSDPGIETCPIRLLSRINIDNEINLTWNDYTGWIAGVDTYTVEKYDALGAPLNTFTVVGNTFDDLGPDPTNQTFIYIVKANANAPGLGQAASNEVTATKRLIINYPTAFTPNGDNLNDTFQPEIPSLHDYLAKFEMKIFNRWGELLFTTKDIDQGWDGKFKGRDQPEGTYVYVSSITDFSGKSFNQSGSVVLLDKP